MNIISLFKQNSETAVRRFVMTQLDKMNIPFYRDKVGNIYNITDKPLLCAHMDFITFVNNPIVKRYDNYLIGIGMGGDDKCGVYAILKILEEIKTSFIFTVDEERGGRGITNFVLQNEINVPYCLVLDRRGSNDIICTRNDYGSKRFENELLRIGKEYGFKQSPGIFCDANILSRYTSCANISVGYYKPHTAKDYVNLDELQNSIEFVKDCLENIKGKFPHKRASRVKTPLALREMEFFFRDFSCTD